MQEQQKDWEQELHEVIYAMYQNREESYGWIETHFNEVKDCLVAAIEKHTIAGENTAVCEQRAVTILEHLLTAYKGYHIIDMADCLKYEVCDFIGVEE